VEIHGQPDAITKAIKRPERPDVFICYARADEEFVWSRLVAALEARGKSVWIDRADIAPAADWRERIEKGIDAARAFVFVLSRDSVTSYECGHELRQALTANKRLIPILYGDVGPDVVSEELRRPNWITLHDDEEFDDQFELLIAALETDLEWVDTHARLSVRAKEWEQAARDRSLLLRGGDLKAAERWLGSEGSHAEAATAGHRAYILAGRQAATRRHTTIVAAIVVALAVSAGLATLAIVRARERQTALKQRQLADSGQVAAEASSLHLSQPDLSMLLGVEAFHMSATAAARSSLLSEQAQLFAGAFPPQQNGIISIALSPDGRTLATATAGAIRFWSVPTHKLETSVHSFSLTGHIAFSPNGDVLAEAGYDGVTFWDGRDPHRQLGGFTAPKLNIQSIAISPDNRIMAVGALKGLIAIVALPSGMTLRTFKVFRRDTSMVAFDPVNPDVLGAVGDHQTVRLIDVRNGRQLESYPGDSSPIYEAAIAFSPDGNAIATAATDHDVTIWSTHAHRLLMTLQGAPNAVASIAFSPDGRIVATASGRDATLWSTAGGQELTVLPPLASSIDDVAFTADGHTLATASNTDATAFLWRMQGNVLLDGFRILSVAFSHDGRVLAAADANGTIRLFDAATHRPELTLHAGGAGLGSATRDVSFGPGDHLIATAGGTTAWVWALPSGRVVAKVPVGGVDVLSGAAISPDGRTLAVGGIPGPISLIDIRTRRVVARLHEQLDFAAYTQLLFTPDGRYVLADSAKIIIWSARPPYRLVGTLGASPPDSVAVSPDGRTVAAGYADGSIVLWDLPTGRRLTRQLNPFGGHLGAVQGLAFSPDGRVLASAGQDDTVKLWDLVGSRKLIATLSGHTDRVNTVAFAPDGTLASGGDDGVLITWDLSPASVAAQICATLLTNLTRDDWARYIPDARFRSVCPETAK
jgi:WD40 repeat protein